MQDSPHWAHSPSFFCARPSPVPRGDRARGGRRRFVRGRNAPLRRLLDGRHANPLRLPAPGGRLWSVTPAQRHPSWPPLCDPQASGAPISAQRPTRSTRYPSVNYPPAQRFVPSLLQPSPLFVHHPLYSTQPPNVPPHAWLLCLMAHVACPWRFFPFTPLLAFPAPSMPPSACAHAFLRPVGLGCSSTRRLRRSSAKVTFPWSSSRPCSTAARPTRWSGHGGGKENGGSRRWSDLLP